MTKNKNRKEIQGNRDMNFLAFTCSLLLFSGILYWLLVLLGLKDIQQHTEHSEAVDSEANIAAMEAQNNSLDS
jgi:hypothetical protein